MGVEERSVIVVVKDSNSSSSISAGVGELRRCRLDFRLLFEVVLVVSSRLTLSNFSAKDISLREGILTNEMLRGC